MSDLLQWFGEQSEAVKLALIGLFGGLITGFWAVVKEWRKPVFAAQSPSSNTTQTAPRSADDPVLLLLASVTAIDANLAILVSTMKGNETGQAQRIDKVLTAITELSHQVERLRDSIKDA